MIEKEIKPGTRMVLWFSRAVRWGLGMALFLLGYFKERDWPVMIFAAVLFLTGFLRPRHCLGDSCENK